jgi:hypothetical protein
MRRRVRVQTAIRASCQRCITSRTPSVHTLDALHEFVAGFHANRTFRGMGRDHRIPKVFLCLVMRSNVMISPLTVLAVRSRAHPVRAFDIVEKGLSESIYSAVSDSEDLFFFSLVQAVPHISGCANHPLGFLRYKYNLHFIQTLGEERDTADIEFVYLRLRAQICTNNPYRIYDRTLARVSFYVPDMRYNLRFAWFVYTAPTEPHN